MLGGSNNLDHPHFGEGSENMHFHIGSCTQQEIRAMICKPSTTSAQPRSTCEPSIAIVAGAESPVRPGNQS